MVSLPLLKLGDCLNSQVVHPDGSEEVEETPYPKVFLGEVRTALPAVLHSYQQPV